MTKQKLHNQGFAMFATIISVLSVSLIVGIGMSFIIYSSVLDNNDRVHSLQSYFTSQSGVEDSLYRIKNSLNVPASYTLAVGATQSTIDVSADIGGARTITSEADSFNRIRTIQATYAVTTEEVNFFYGVQAGDGGILMGNNAEIIGNVFSNGSILPLGGGSADVTGNVTVSQNGRKIDSLNVGGDAYGHTCDDSDITGTLYYTSNGSEGDCTYGALSYLGPQDIDPIPLPITIDQINQWRSDAEAGGTIVGNYSLINGATATLGPVKITGDLLVDNGAILTMEGTIYVEGQITISNNATAKLDVGYSSMSGVLFSDGPINILNNAILQGSGDATSYLLILSTDNSVDPANPAINVENNALGAIFYATNGAVKLNNNINVKEATGYKLILNNNAIVEYESGLANTFFSAGPGGGWQLTNWEEIE